MTNAFIYALVDSRAPDSYRYIGKTVRSVETRLFFHLYGVRRGTEVNLHKSRWMQNVARDGGEVVAIVLEECAVELQDEREIFHIAQARMSGHSLTNLSDGGEGGLNPDPLVREKISRALKGRKYSEQAIESYRSAAKRRDIKGCRNPNFGKTHSKETREKISEALVGKKLSSAHKDALRVALKGVNAKLTEEQVLRVVELRKSGLSQQKIADIVGIGQSQVSRILLGKKWSHLTGIGRNNHGTDA